MTLLDVKIYNSSSDTPVFIKGELKQLHNSFYTLSDL